MFNDLINNFHISSKFLFLDLLKNISSKANIEFIKIEWSEPLYDDEGGYYYILSNLIIFDKNNNIYLRLFETSYYELEKNENYFNEVSDELDYPDNSVYYELFEVIHGLGYQLFNDFLLKGIYE